MKLPNWVEKRSIMERVNQKKSHKGVEGTNPQHLPEPDFAPDLRQMTPDLMRYLQRTIGNSATRDVIHRIRMPDPGPKPQQPLVQRAPTGLAQTLPTASVAAAGHTFVNNPDNADKHPRELVNAIMSAINAELRAISVPETSVSLNDAGGNLGTFSFDTWTIDLSPSAVFNNKTKISDLTEDEAAEAVNTLHHESRHCEQWYRMARLLAGKLLGVPTTILGGIIQVVTVAAQIANDMGIPARIALMAAMNPLYNTGSQESAEAQAWYDSVYGANAAYRELILGSLDTAIDPLNGQLNDLLSAVRLKNAATTDYDRDTAQAEVDNHIATVNNQLANVYAVRDGALQTEYTRLSGISTRNAIENTMFAHAGNLINIIDQIRALTLSETTAGALRTLVQQLGVERYQAYHDLPEEDDAHAVGDAAGAVYRAGQSVAPTAPI